MYNKYVGWRGFRETEVLLKDGTKRYNRYVYKVVEVSSEGVFTFKVYYHKRKRWNLSGFEEENKAYWFYQLDAERALEMLPVYN